jgi:DNA-binding beta-propeller fold protein YncE
MSNVVCLTGRFEAGRAGAAWRRWLAAAAAVGAAVLGAAAHAQQPLQNVLLVGNSQSGTVTFISDGGFSNLGSVNVIPDLQQRLREMDPFTRLIYEITKAQKGGDRFVDDIAVSPDGKTMYVSRSNLVDVVAVDLASPLHPILWRYKLPGVNADHMGMAPDGKTIAVSASSDGHFYVLDTQTGGLVAKVPTGSFPHQNDYSADGKYIYNTSIGNVTLPYALNALKGSKSMTVVDAKTYQVVRSWSLPYGIRPNVITRDGKLLYTQLSYLNGYAKVDMQTGQVLQQVELPFSDWATSHYPNKDDYPQNSAHHGLAISGDETRLCLAGTIDNYIAIVSVPAMTTERILPSGGKPYWSTTSADGRHCYVSNSDSGDVSVVHYPTAQELVRVKVGTFPQRSRLAKVPAEVLSMLLSTGG